MNERNIETVQKIIVMIIAVAFGLIVAGCVAIPAVVAALYGWYYLTIYPAVLFLLVAFLPRKQK